MPTDRPQITIGRLMLAVAASAVVMWFSRLLGEYPTLAEMVWLTAAFALAVALYLLTMFGGVLVADACRESPNFPSARRLWERLLGRPRPPRSWKPTRSDPRIPED